MLRSRSVTFVFVTGTIAMAFGACDDGVGVYERCPALGAEGCPGNSLTACDDPACAFVSSCDLRSGIWQRVGSCRRDGGTGDGAASDADESEGAPTDGAGWRDVGARTDGGPDEVCPPLSLPDCSESQRAACGADCCGCEDVFACRAGGWDYVGPCISP